MLDQVTDLFKFRNSVIWIVDNKEIHNVNDVIVQILELISALGVNQELTESVLLTNESTWNKRVFGKGYLRCVHHIIS